MIVRVNEVVYRVHFEHVTKRDKKSNGRTKCVIELIDAPFSGEEPFEPTEAGYGVAVCMKPDIFSKATGRRVSLEKALADWDYDRDERKAFWDVYFSQCADFK